MLSDLQSDAADEHRPAAWQVVVPLVTLVESERSRIILWRDDHVEAPRVQVAFDGMAGRCLSSSHEAQASLRVIGTSLATGEAVGRAAAAQAKGGPP